MITRFRVQNYKALRDVSLDLTPIHVLIGPNDSGKTSILEAVTALSRSVDHPLNDAFTGVWEGTRLVLNGHPDLAVSLTANVSHAGKELEYLLACRFAPTGRIVRTEDEYIRLPIESEVTRFNRKNLQWSFVFETVVHAGVATAAQQEITRIVHDALEGVHLCRWDARLLALPVAPDSKRSFRMEPNGFGLALCLDDILGYDRDLFGRLENRFTRVFPSVKSIKLIPERAFRSPADEAELIPLLSQSDGKGLYFQFHGRDQLISAAQVSDGILLVLAYLTILHLPKPPRLVLVEEPENGIHPKRLHDVLSILRDLVQEQSHSQVILSTHSPYVVDLFQPNEVTLCQKGEDASINVRRLSDSPTVREQLDVFTLGEIWTAEGDEAIARSSATAGGQA